MGLDNILGYNTYNNSSTKKYKILVLLLFLLVIILSVSTVVLLLNNNKSSRDTRDDNQIVTPTPSTTKTPIITPSQTATTQTTSVPTPTYNFYDRICIDENAEINALYEQFKTMQTARDVNILNLFSQPKTTTEEDFLSYLLGTDVGTNPAYPRIYNIASLSFDMTSMTLVNASEKYGDTGCVYTSNEVRHIEQQGHISDDTYTTELHFTKDLTTNKWYVEKYTMISPKTALQKYGGFGGF